jgi:hypothetical protein
MRWTTTQHTVLMEAPLETTDARQGQGRASLSLGVCVGQCPPVSPTAPSQVLVLMVPVQVEPGPWKTPLQSRQQAHSFTSAATPSRRHTPYSSAPSYTHPHGRNGHLHPHLTSSYHTHTVTPIPHVICAQSLSHTLWQTHVCTCLYTHIHPCSLSDVSFPLPNLPGPLCVQATCTFLQRCPLTDRGPLSPCPASWVTVVALSAQV